MHSRRRFVSSVLALLLPLLSHASSAAPAPGSSEATAWLATRWAQSDLERLAGAARRWREEKGAWPADCRDASRSLQPPPAADPWGSQYGCRMDGNSLVVFSPGPDGRPGTADDLSLDAGSAAVAPASVTPAPSAPSAPSEAAAPVPPAIPEEVATAATLRSLADALESFRRKEGRYPVTDKVEHLERWLVSEHLAGAAWTSKDAWGRPLRYRTTDVGSSYTLASAGSDGRWEALSEGLAWPAEGGDLALADGHPARWPPALATPAAGTRPAAGAPPSDARTTPSEPRDPAELTRHRVARLAGLAAERRSGGRFIESDDAERLAREWGNVSASDGWGRPLHYLSADGGRRCAVASAGPDGRLALGMEAYARGAAASGDDIVAHDGKLD